MTTEPIPTVPLERFRTLAVELPGSVKTDFNYSYGDNHVAARYCGHPRVPGPIDGEWQHGWIVKERNIHPEFVVGSDGLSRTRRSRRYFVARQDQAEYLRSQGYQSVEPIGLPITYVPVPTVERIAGSLLVMPVHSLTDTQEQWNEDEYADYIASIAGRFSEVVLCVHRSCFVKGNWIGAFARRGIPAVLGADPDDANTYDRLALLFSRFEFVTTNSMGSHVAYGAYFGAKPSIAGPKPRFSRRDYERLTFYKNAPEVLDIVAEWNTSDRYRSIAPFLYTDPISAADAREWGEDQLGLRHRRTPAELNHLFGWSLRARIRKNGMKMFRTLKKTLRQPLRLVDALRQRMFARSLATELSIVTHMTFDERYLLYHYAKQLPAGAAAAEIGSFLGASSCCISAGLPAGGKLYCIDTWGNHAMAYSETDAQDRALNERDTYEEFRANTIRFRDRIVELRGWSTDVITQLRQKETSLGLLFIDGDHTYEGVKKDWDAYRPLLIPGSLVAFHDTGWAEGVQRLIAEEVTPSAQLVQRLSNFELYRIIR